MRRLVVAALLIAALPAILLAAPLGGDRPPDRSAEPSRPPYVQRVLPAIVGMRVQVPADRPSTLTLGRERWASGVIFDAAGHILTVSYALLDAETIEVTLRDGRRVPARLVGIDLETGLGVAKLEWPGPWPTATLGDSRAIVAGEASATVGVDDEGDLVVTQGRIEAIRPYAAAWEYMLDRSFIVSPANPAFGGGALIDKRGTVIGITSLRLGDRPFTNLAIPVEKFLPTKDELIARGRVESRPARPWLGLYTQPLEGHGLVVVGVSPAGPAGQAGIRRGDLIVKVAGEAVTSHEDFYRWLWARKLDEDVVVVVRREDRFEAITVRPADRYRVFRTR